MRANGSHGEESSGAILRVTAVGKKQLAAEQESWALLTEGCHPRAPRYA